MLDQLFNLLAQRPALSILLIFILLALLGGISLIVYKDTFALWLRKVLKAYDTAEIRSAVEKAHATNDRIDFDPVPDVLATMVLDNLEHKPTDK